MLKVIDNEESRIKQFQKHEPIWGAPGVSWWAILKFRLVRLLFIDLLTPATIFAIISTVWMYHWLYSGHLESTIVALAILFIYMVSWLLLIRRSEAGMLLQALASLIKGISIRWGSPAIAVPVANDHDRDDIVKAPSIQGLLRENNDD